MDTYAQSASTYSANTTTPGSAPNSPKRHEPDNGIIFAIMGIICGITLVMILVFAVKRGDETAQLKEAREQISQLTDENKDLKETNTSLQKQVDDLQEDYDKSQESLRKAKRKAETYDDLVEAFADIYDALGITPKVELKQGFGR